MKKLVVTIAIVLGLGMTSFADNGGLFQRGEAVENNNGTIYGAHRDGTPMLPGHGSDNNQPAPVGSGIAVLTVLGAAYLVGKRKQED